METKIKFGYRNVIFDCDSTLTFIEGADEIARRKGLAEEVARITHRGMNGEISFTESLRCRLRLIRPGRKDLDFLYHQYLENLVEDVAAVIQALQFLGKEVYIVTGGYQEAVEKLAVHLGLREDHVFGVRLRFGKNEDFVGFRQGHLTRNGGKAKVIRRISRTGPTLFVGDGVTDLEAKGETDLFVGFGGVVVRRIVKENCGLFLDSKTLAPILPLSCFAVEVKIIEGSRFRPLYEKGYNVLRDCLEIAAGERGRVHA